MYVWKFRYNNNNNSHRICNTPRLQQDKNEKKNLYVFYIEPTRVQYSPHVNISNRQFVNFPRSQLLLPFTRVLFHTPAVSYIFQLNDPIMRVEYRVRTINCSRGPVCDSNTGTYTRARLRRRWRYTRVKNFLVVVKRIRRALSWSGNIMFYILYLTP